VTIHFVVIPNYASSRSARKGAPNVTIDGDGLHGVALEGGATLSLAGD
jgi:hypothetical protein